jgi:hypothetical protein
MAQLINITSEALQATIRRLLPSQQGFGEDLQATNVVTPIIDLTPTAEGSVLPTELQQALNLGGATAVNSQNNTVNVTSTTGFFRLTGGITVLAQSGSQQDVTVKITDGLSTKIMWSTVLVATGAATAPFQIIDFDKIFFVDAGDTLQVTTSSVSRFDGSVRQLATKNGTLVNPSGFTFE